MDAPVVLGFRIVRTLGAETWEAVEVALDRSVAVRRVGQNFDASRWPERAGVSSLFTVVDGTDAQYVVTQIPSHAQTFAERVAEGAAVRDQRRWLDRIARALDGVSHGRLSTDDILIGDDGTVLLIGFGEAPDATAEADRRVLEQLQPAAPSRTRAIGLTIAGVVILTALVAAGLRWQHRHVDPPPVVPGAAAYGSSVTANASEPLDCLGERPSGNSPSCTLMQTALPGRRTEAAAGRARQWVVRGVHGRVRLEVIVPKGQGWQRVARSYEVLIDDASRPHTFGTDLRVPAGARFGLQLSPGSAVGLHRGVPGARLARFFGPPSPYEPSIPSSKTGIGEELLLRVDVVPSRR